MDRLRKQRGASENSQRVAQGKSSVNSREGEPANSINASPLMVAQRAKLESLFGGAIQRQNPHEEMLQGKFVCVQRARNEASSAGGFVSEAPAQREQAPAAKQNGTGLPDNLKAGIESLSGMSLDNVKVHYNSSQPAQLNALAYAQGTDIHVAPGQERHLPHEAWHVVQQAQGRVNPTMQMMDGVPVNDDKGLEHEADAMGEKAVQMMGCDRQGMAALHLGHGGRNGACVQRVERTTSIYNRQPQSNNFIKGMEIVDSTSPEAYVHLSRSAPVGEHTVNIQQNPNFFNGLMEQNKRSRVVEEDPGNDVDLSAYTRESNAHITLEGRYGFVMSELANGFADLGGIKSGAPVVDGFTNLNFGSYEDHGRVQVSERDVFTYIHDYAEDATECVMNRQEDFEGQRNELVGQIDAVENATSALADRLIQDSPLNDLDDGDFVHYGGEAWDPIIPGDLR